MCFFVWVCVGAEIHKGSLRGAHICHGWCDGWRIYHGLTRMLVYHSILLISWSIVLVYHITLLTLLTLLLLSLHPRLRVTLLPLSIPLSSCVRIGHGVSSCVSLRQAVCVYVCMCVSQQVSLINYPSSSVSVSHMCLSSCVCHAVSLCRTCVSHHAVSLSLITSVSHQHHLRLIM